MACHQAHNIPWATLASNFKYKHKHRHQGQVERTNLYPRFKENQGKEIHYFINAFVSNLNSFAEDRLRDLPDLPETLDPDETVLDPDTVKRITPSLHHATKEILYWGEFSSPPSHIPAKYTKTRAFLHHTTAAAADYSAWGGHAAFFSLELFKLLLLHGALDPLQRICRHPRADWTRGWYRPRDAFGDQKPCGWSHVARLALKSYISLNLLLCFPALWDESCGRGEESEYTSTACYQRALRDCTMDCVATHIAALPHRQFFGVADGQFGEFMPSRAVRHEDLLRERYGPEGYPCGRVPIAEFLELEGEAAYRATVDDVLHVRWCLCARGLPVEVAILCMDFAGYVPARRLPRAHDPLHRENLGELQKYLGYCWEVLVRCEVVGTWLGSRIPWDRLAGEALVHLVGDSHGGPGVHGRRFYRRDWNSEWEGFAAGEYDTFVFL